MKTFWLKFASVAIGILIIIVLISMFKPGDNQESTESEDANSPPSDFYGQTEIDQETYLTEPEPVENIEIEPVNDIEVQNPPVEPVNDVEPTEVQPVVEPPKVTEITVYVKQLGELEKLEAERELQYAVPSRSIARLPGTSYGPMIESARRIISRWPDSWYAYQAMNLIDSIPEGYKQQFNITEEETDTSMFMSPRAGTVPVKYKIEE